MDIETSEQLAFIPEQVESILMTVVDGILRTEVYLEEKVRRLAFDCKAKKEGEYASPGLHLQYCSG